MISRADFAAEYTEALTQTRRFLQSRGVSPEEAHEIAQAAWTRAWERRAQLRNDALLRTWVNRIAWNLYLKMKRRTPCVSLAEVPARCLEWFPGEKILVEQLMARARTQDQELLYAWSFMGYTFAELAHLYQIDRGAIRVRLHRAKQRLVDHGGTLANCRVSLISCVLSNV